MSTTVDESVYKKYFIYSKEQEQLRYNIELKLGKKFLPGIIIIDGSEYNFTEIVDNLSKLKYSDSEIVAYADIRSATYRIPI